MTMFHFRGNRMEITVPLFLFTIFLIFGNKFYCEIDRLKQELEECRKNIGDCEKNTVNPCSQ